MNGNATTPPIPLNEQVMSVPNKWEQIEARVNALEKRVLDLEQQRLMTPDDVSEQCFQFLKRMAGVKFNTGSIASNIGSVNVKISGRLQVMADKGMIKHEKLVGISTMYWYEIPTNEGE